MPSIQYLPHQSRVLDEHDELSDKLKALTIFNKTNPLFDSLPELEQKRLIRQEDYMRAYLQILAERIDYFKREHFKKQTAHTDLAQDTQSEVFCNASVERAFQNWLLQETTAE